MQAIFGVSKTCVSNWRDEGAPFKKVGNRVYFKLPEFLEWYGNRKTRVVKVAQPKPEKEADPRYNREWIKAQLLSKVGEKGTAGVGAAKEIVKLLDDEPPSEDEDIHISFVPIKFVDREFIANLEDAEQLADE